MVWLRIKRTLRALPKWQLAVLVMFFGWLFLTLFGPYLAPFPTEVAEPTTRLLPPSGTYPFGTDENGIDIFSRVLAAPRTDVVIGVVATAISVLLGAPLGVIVALYESRGGAGSTAFAETFMRVLEVIQSFPVFVFAMVLVAVFGGSVTNIIIAIAFVNTPVFVRIVRSDVLTLVQRPFAEAARAVGNREVRIGFRHVLPNALPTVIVQVSVTVGFAILLTAGLSFVGAGVKPPTAELGAMIASGAKYLELGQWWAAFFPRRHARPDRLLLRHLRRDHDPGDGATRGETRHRPPPRSRAGDGRRRARGSRGPNTCAHTYERAGARGRALGRRRRRHGPAAAE